MSKYRNRNQTNFLPIFLIIIIFGWLFFKFDRIPKTVMAVWNRDPYISFCALCVVVIIIAGVYQLITNSSYSGSWSNYFILTDVDYKTKSHSKYENKKESKGEVECRKVLEELFGVPFGKARPDFLNNPVTGGNFNLELDCYNKNLKLAVEYNGVQHYKYTPFFHKNQEAFQNQKYRDELKRRMCKDNMITLIEVPYTVKIIHIKSFLMKELLKSGYIST